MSEFIKALSLVVVAEMGDKTQLLAMAFAGKYRAKQVLIGVFIATIFNHALAVAVGNVISKFIPMNYISIVAAVSFLVFGLWTVRGDSIDEENEKKTKFGPIVTVAIAFFLAEMGDKTQLMTITIAAGNVNPLIILMGTTTGMMIADGIGILGGAWMCRHIPEIYIKWAAGIVFMFFGTITLYSSVPASIKSPVCLVAYFVVLVILTYIVGVKFGKHGQACEIALTKKEDIEK